MSVYSLGNAEMTLSRAEMNNDSQSRKREVDTLAKNNYIQMTSLFWRLWNTSFNTLLTARRQYS
jgi:hypothetical protein